jgi:hypothetical protein
VGGPGTPPFWRTLEEFCTVRNSARRPDRELVYFVFQLNTQHTRSERQPDPITDDCHTLVLHSEPGRARPLSCRLPGAPTAFFAQENACACISPVPRVPFLCRHGSFAVGLHRITRGVPRGHELEVRQRVGVAGGLGLGGRYGKGREDGMLSGLGPSSDKTPAL